MPGRYVEIDNFNRENTSERARTPPRRGGRAEEIRVGRQKEDRRESKQRSCAETREILEGTSAAAEFSLYLTRAPFPFAQCGGGVVINTRSLLFRYLSISLHRRLRAPPSLSWRIPPLLPSFSFLSIIPLHDH